MCHTNSFSLLARCPCVARNIKMHLNEKFILWEKRMNEGMPYLQIRRGGWVSFFKIAIFSFLSVRYKSDGLYCRMAGTPSSPTLFFIRVEICECQYPPTHTHTPTLPNTEGVGWHLDLDTNLSTGFSLKHTHTHYPHRRSRVTPRSWY